MTCRTLRLSLVLAWAMTACADSPRVATAPDAPAPPKPVASLAVSGPLRFVGATLSAKLSVPGVNPDPNLSASWWSARRIRWESANPAIAAVSPRNHDSEASVSLLGEGSTFITAWVDGVASTVATVRVERIPPPTQALVVERFTLFDFADPYEAVGTGNYMPLIRLREPSGTRSATIVAVRAAMPMAPPTGWCTPNPARTWAPGTSAELLGLDRYFHEPEFWFGPYVRSSTIGPVEVTIVVRDGTGALGSITLSKTMGATDISTVAPRVMEESHLGCS
jgi:hypothetical protein